MTALGTVVPPNVWGLVIHLLFPVVLLLVALLARWFFRRVLRALPDEMVERLLGVRR